MENFMNKTYVPRSNAKAQETAIGEVIRLSFHVESLVEFAKEHENSGGYINIDVVPRREPNDKATHSLTLNDWTPDKSKAKQTTKKTSKPAKEKPKSSAQQIDASEQVESEEIPF